MTEFPAGAAETVLVKPLASRFGRWWWTGIGVSAGLLMLLLYALIAPIAVGIGTWGNDVPFVWGLDLAGYFWWIGIANGGALLATLLVLFRAPLRLAASRLAETLGVAAALCAAIFPVIHLGRPLLAYWVAPYPAHTGLWPQPISPLTWDFWGIVSHLITLTLLWYIGLIPDLALLRDRARRPWASRAYGLAALGWRGSSTQWALQMRAHRMIAISVIPFLFVMQTIVALELATTIVPDWHDSGLPVRVVVSGFASGLGMLLFAGSIFARPLGLAEAGGLATLDTLCRIVLATSLLSAFVVALTTLFAWLGPEGRDSVHEWTGGPSAWISWVSLVLSKLAPQLFWSARFRRNRAVAGAVGLGIAVGVWLDYFAVIVLALSNDRLIDPADLYAPSLTEWALMAGTLGLFAFLMLLAARTIPVLSVHELLASDDSRERR